MEEQSTQEEQKKVELSTGEILKQAREAKGLSLNELADLIRVPVNVIEAIEIDRVPKNLPETFIRGYIRAYAKKVDVEESRVLTAIDSSAVAEPIEKEMQSFSRRTKRQQLEKRLMYSTWILGGILVIAIVIWWMQDNANTDIAPVAATEDSLSVEAEQIDDTSELNSSSDEQLQDNDVAQSTNLDNPPQENEPAKAVEKTTQQPLKLSPAEKALIADNGEVDEEGFMKVEMRFENDCWVEVYDVFEERIAVGNKPGGYLMTLNAQGPLRVLLGNPAGVEIWVNGKPYDTSQHPKNRVARFELEPQ